MVETVGAEIVGAEISLESLVGSSVEQKKGAIKASSALHALVTVSCRGYLHFDIVYDRHHLHLNELHSDGILLLAVLQGNNCVDGLEVFLLQKAGNDLINYQLFTKTV